MCIRDRDYAERGFLAYPLCSEKFGVWLPEGHALAKKDEIAVEDLKGCLSYTSRCV